MKKWISRILLVIATVVPVGAVAATPAHASQEDCYDVWAVCLWSGGEPFTGTIHRISIKPLGYCYNVPSSYNDRAVHFWNRMGTRHVQFYKDANCTGHLLHKNVPGCTGGPHPGGSTGEFWWDRGWTGNCHGPVVDTHVLTSVFFNTG